MTKQCPSCGGDCGYTKAKGCQYDGISTSTHFLPEAKRTNSIGVEIKSNRAWREDAELMRKRMEQQAKLADEWYGDLVAARKAYNDLVDEILDGTPYQHIDDFLKHKKEDIALWRKK